jgi:hypothetical protein
MTAAALLTSLIASRSDHVRAKKRFTATVSSKARAASLQIYRVPSLASWPSLWARSLADFASLNAFCLLASSAATRVAFSIIRRRSSFVGV